MPRVTVWVPDHLHAAVKAQLPKLNLSRAMQRGLAASMECNHERLECVHCATPVYPAHAVVVALEHFYLELLAEIQRLIYHGATAEGVGRVAKELGIRHGIPAAENRALPRPQRRAPGRSPRYWKNPYAAKERSA